MPPASLPRLSTERLELRQVTMSDLDILTELNADPAVMAYILGRAATPAETRDEWERRLTRQSRPELGLGYWLGVEEGTIVGWWSASWYAPRPEFSGIGYRLHTEAWGRGLATEGARAMVEQALTVPGIERVVASTMAVNQASRRVLSKLGMTHTDTWFDEWDEPIPGSEHGEVGYELTRSTWWGSGHPRLTKTNVTSPIPAITPEAMATVRSLPHQVLSPLRKPTPGSSSA